MKQFKKVLSILCAIALLVSSLALALAEEEPAVEQPVVEEPVVNEPVLNEPVVNEPVVNEPVVNEPVVNEPVVNEPVVNEPVVNEPVVNEPVVNEPVVNEPVVNEPVVNEPVVNEPVVEEPVADEPAVDESVDNGLAVEEPAVEEPVANEGASEMNEDAADDDGLYVIGDDPGSADSEVIEENTPPITDVLKGLRTAEMKVGDVLSDSLNFDEELTVTLMAGAASTIELKLYTNDHMNIKVDGKAVGFTPADSDILSMNLYVYELENAAGRNHEIVLDSDDNASFVLTAEIKQSAPIEEAPVQEEVSSNEGNAENNDDSAEEIITEAAEEEAADVSVSRASTETAIETPAPSIQASVKTYDTLKVGNQISDTLVAGQKAKIQVKCGKNPYVTLTLKADSDELIVAIDGIDAQFTAAGNGIYTVNLDEVAFRKFNVIISAKLDLAFTLSEVANGEAVEEDDNELEEEKTDEPEEEEKANEETIQEENEVIADEEDDEASEEVNDESVEDTDNNEEEAEDEAEAPGVENEGEQAENEEENSDKETEEEPADTEEESIEAEEEPADAKEKPVDAEEDSVDAEEKSGDESADEEVADEAAEEVEPLTDEQMLELGYTKVQVAVKDGGHLYQSRELIVEPYENVEAGSELWVVNTDDPEWAAVYNADEKTILYIQWNEIIIMLQNETEEEQINRMIKVINSIDQGGFVAFGSDAYVQVELINFMEDDQAEIQWFYTADGGETWNLIDGANDLVYQYEVDFGNWYYGWKAVVTL